MPLRLSHPKMVHYMPASDAVVDMDMAMHLLHHALSALGCDFHPLLVVEEKYARELGCSARIVDGFC